MAKRSLLNVALPSAISVLLSLLVCFLAIALTRKSFEVAWDAYSQMLWGGVGDWPGYLDEGDWLVITRPLGESAAKAAILMMTGLAVAVPFGAGLFNIGAQGQLMVGAIAAAAIGSKAHLPWGVHPFVCILVASLVAGAYGLVPAWLKLRRGVHEVISTIMLNWVAVSLVENWLVVGPLRASASGDNSISGTDEIELTAQLPRLLGDWSRLHAGFPLAIALTIIVWLWFTRTRQGYETRAVGFNPDAAQAAGIGIGRRMVQSMAIGGALAGIAGALLVLGTEYKFPATLSAPYGFDGIAISLIGQNHPLGVAITALIFGILRAGGTRMQLLGVHKSFPELIQGLALLFVAGKAIWTYAIGAWQRRLDRPHQRPALETT